MEQFKASELVERLNEIIKKHGDVDVAVKTEEMRDAFYNNFKELIEQCKELL